MSTHNLSHHEAIDKIKEMAGNIKVAMLLTGLNHPPIHVNPMKTKRVDDDGSIWFLSSIKSDHNKNIQTDCNIQLIYSNPGDDQYLTIHGEAFTRSHMNDLKNLYDNSDDKWFKGIDDPTLTAIHVIPQKAFYWSKKNNEFINFFEKGIDKLTGQENDNQEKGKLKL